MNLFWKQRTYWVALGVLWGISLWATVQIAAQSAQRGIVELTDFTGKAGISAGALSFSEDGANGMFWVDFGCGPLEPSLAWFLLLAFLALLLGNFWLSARKTGRVGTWFELVLLGIFLAMWYFFDECSRFWWLPVSLVYFGALGYITALSVSALAQKEPGDNH